MLRVPIKARIAVIPRYVRIYVRRRLRSGPVVVRQRVKLPHRARREFSNRWRPREGSQNGANNLLPAGARTGWPGAPIV
jgi:hypothetical protein